MPEDIPSPGKKHRVIAWKPANSPADPNARARLPKWVTIVAGTGGALLLLVALVGGYVVYKINRMQQEAEIAASLETSPGQNLREAFVGRSRAEYAREAAMRGLEGVRKTPSDHPAILRRLIEIERLLLTADKAFGDGSYGLAVRQFDGIAAETKDFGAKLEDMRKAREGYDKFLVNVGRVEPLKALAPQTYDNALTAAGAARTFLDEGNFSLARQKIDEATVTLQSIEQSISNQLEESLAAGRAALSQGDGDAATAAFTKALELQPGNDFAVKSLERAKTIGRVFALIGEAGTLEAGKDFEKAQASFEQAFKIDAQSATAQAGVARMKAAIRERDFNAALDLARTASDEGRWNDAITAYETALKLFPDDTNVKELLAKGRVLQREAFIQDSLATAYDREREYDWNGARRVYLDLLKFEPQQVDAEEGLLRTGKVLRALLKFERLMDDSRSQAQQANFQPAIAAFNEALANKPEYLSLTPAQEELRLLLERQSRPVEITLVSDNRTYVTIQGVRLLGKFERTSLPILPGNYEIIGRRRGYADVREVIRVRGEEPIPPITVVANSRMTF